MNFSSITKFNRYAFILFIVAKLNGCIGVSLGFLGGEYHQYGGFLLCIAIICIFLSVIFSIKQMSVDKIIFEHEDDENIKLKNLILKKNLLENEIFLLQEKRLETEKFLLRKK